MRWTLLTVLLVVLSGCETERIAVSAAQAHLSPARQALLEAVARFSSDDNSTPETFLKLADEVNRLGTRLTEEDAQEAERHLVFLAVEPLDALAGESWEVQLDRLATTVWPTALGIAPDDGETSAAFAARICNTELASECKYIVPEYQSVILSKLVWRKLEDRAREAFARCRPCKEDSSYVERLARYEAGRERVAREAALAEHLGNRNSWPQAGAGAKPWSDHSLLAVNFTGKASLAGKPLEPGTWRRRLVDHRADTDDSRTLGVHLIPSTRVGDLREILDHAAAAGYARIALQARHPAYPYRLAEYRVNTTRNADQAPIPIRDADNIQVLILALDKLTSADRSVPSL